MACGESQRNKICVENVVDGNFMNETKLQSIQSAEAQVDVQTIDHHRIFNMAVVAPKKNRKT